MLHPDWKSLVNFGDLLKKPRWGKISKVDLLKHGRILTLIAKRGGTRVRRREALVDLCAGSAYPVEKNPRSNIVGSSYSFFPLVNELSGSQVC
ncbi:MAG: hypothetical protein ACYDA1_02470 [Vulcanimicrobiaceae bacterium]